MILFFLSTPTNGYVFGTVTVNMYNKCLNRNYPPSNPLVYETTCNLCENVSSKKCIINTKKSYKGAHVIFYKHYSKDKKCL